MGRLTSVPAPAQWRPPSLEETLRASEGEHKLRKPHLVGFVRSRSSPGTRDGEGEGSGGGGGGGARGGRVLELGATRGALMEAISGIASAMDAEDEREERERESEALGRGARER
jgi:hypothetical protein